MAILKNDFTTLEFPALTTVKWESVLIVELHLEFCKRSAFIYTFTDYMYIDR